MSPDGEGTCSASRACRATAFLTRPASRNPVFSSENGASVLTAKARVGTAALGAAALVSGVLGGTTPSVWTERPRSTDDPHPLESQAAWKPDGRALSGRGRPQPRPAEVRPDRGASLGPPLRPPGRLPTLSRPGPAVRGPRTTAETKPQRCSVSGEEGAPGEPGEQPQPGEQAERPREDGGAFFGAASKAVAGLGVSESPAAPQADSAGASPQEAREMSAGPRACRPGRGGSVEGKGDSCRSGRTSAQARPVRVGHAERAFITQTRELARFPGGSGKFFPLDP